MLLKHSVNKNDKKKRKEINCLIESMENELKFRHELELKNLKNQFLNGSKNVEVETNSEENLSIKSYENKLTRAQKRKVIFKFFFFLNY